MRPIRPGGRWSIPAIVASCFLVIVAVWAVTFERISYERAGDIDDAMRRNSNLALAFEEHTVRTLKVVDQALQLLKAEYRLEGDAIPTDLLRELTRIDPTTYSFLGVVDRRGNMVVSNYGRKPVNFADRPYFTFHRDQPGGGLRIWGTVQGRLTGNKDIQISRRVDRRDGSFGGVVIAGIKPDYFARFYDQVNVGQNGLVQLVSLDGVTLARNTPNGISTGQDMQRSTLVRHALSRDYGSFLSEGRLDGVKRYQSFRVLRDFGLVVAVGTAESEVLAESNERERLYFAGSSAATLFVLIFGGGLIVAVRRQRRAMLTARAGEALYRVTFDQAAVGIAHNALDGKFLRANAKYCELLGYSEEELRSMRFTQMLHPEDVPPPEFMQGLLKRGSAELEKRHIHKNGSVKWASAAVSVVHGPDGKPAYLVAMVQDVNARKLAEERARQAEAPYRVTFDQAAIGIVHTAPDGRLLKVNRSFATMLGYTEDELTTLNFAEVSHPADIEVSLDHLRRLLADPVDRHSCEFEKRYRRRDGGTLWTSLVVSLVRDAQGKPEYFVTMVQDITARKEAQDLLQHQAHYDSLTGLPNRVLLLDRLAQGLAQARRKNCGAAVLFVDLDRFKVVNDTLGHALGDRLLKEATARLASAVRSVDTVARVGGDEFVVVLSELHQASDAARVASKIIEWMALPFLLDGHEVFVTASIGIALFPGDATDGETLIKNADVAMFRAKQAGRNTSQFYETSMNERAVEKLQMEGELRRAVERDEFRLHFQPKAHMGTRRVVGFEALLRWQRAGNGMVSPAVFIPLLEDSGMIVAVGEWVVRAACAQIADWRRAGLAPVPVAVNVSAKQFLHGDLCTMIERALRDHGVEARLLEIEITESDAMQDPERAVKVLRQLRELGVRVAIDDFGTGYSSLGYLKRFPIDFLKLDRSFVTGLPGDADDVSIARAVIGMAHSLGLAVIAEGVETEVQRAFLAANGCDQMQGYLLAKPLPARECVSYLAAAERAAA
jgi:diguanylate cyclase (GGDEF)-like protein/PAS domain S-box-containing protein